MAEKTSVNGVGLTTSETWYPFPPIELGRAGGEVRAVTLLTGGTGYGATFTAAATTTTEAGTGLTLTGTSTAGIVDAVVSIAAGGDGYRLGDTITLSGGGGDATFKVIGLDYPN